MPTEELLEIQKGMLARYKIYRGPAREEHPLPAGVRQDTRKHTRHVLRPTEDMVSRFLDNPSEQLWKLFRREFLELLKGRFKEDRSSFEKLAQLATEQDVFIGCSCPTKTNPDVSHCHTYLALHFMKKKFPELHVVLPEA